jgi:hypothetical protein
MISNDDPVHPGCQMMLDRRGDDIDFITHNKRHHNHADANLLDSV